MTLKEAIDNNNLEKVRELLLMNPALIEEPIHGVWPPFLAASSGNLPVLRYIVEYSRASMNMTDEKNRDILYYGVQSGNAELVEYLVEKVGMDPLHGDIELVTPFDLAVKSGFIKIKEYLEKYCGAPYEDFFRNPVLTGMHPDPSIVCVGEDFYMVNSSFVFFPCIPISHSKDLVNWKTVGYAITNAEWAGLDALEGGRGYWAPDISYFEGRYYITATYRLNDTGTVYRKQMITSSRYPEGPYEKPVFLDEDGIDPSIFTDTDHRRYMILNRGARAFEISTDGKQQLSEAKLLYYGHQKRAPEGSHLLYKDGWYYLFQAEGGTGEGHRISVARARELFGNYIPCPYNPVLQQADEKSVIQCCGHGKPVQAPDGEWYIVYLCSRKWEGKYGFLGRETMLNKLTWTADGWPLINDGRGPGILQRKPMTSPGSTPVKDMHQGVFQGFYMEEDWWTVRSIEKDAIKRISEMIRIKGSRKDLDSKYARNLLLRRQTSFHFSFQSTIQLQEMEAGQYYGLTCYYDENTYLVYGIRMGDGGPALCLWEHILNKTCFIRCLDLTNVLGVEQTKVTLCIETHGLERKFFVNGIKGKQEFAVLPDVYYLCDEGISCGKRFTGAMAGCFVYQGEGRDMSGEFTEILYSNL